MERVLKYQEIESYMLQELSSGRFSVADRFFSETDIAGQFNVTPLTARRAFAQLQNKGYIVRRRGFGTFVKNLPKQPQRLKIIKRCIIGIIPGESGIAVAKADGEDCSLGGGILDNSLKQGRLLIALHYAITQAGYLSMLVGDDLDVLTETEVSGVIVLDRIGELRMRKLLSSGVPVICIHPVHGDMSGLRFDCTDAANRIVECFHRRGTHRMAMVGEGEDALTVRNLFEKTIAVAAGRLGIAVDNLVQPVGPIYKELFALLDAANRPDAIFAMNAYSLGTISEVLKEKKLFPGQDISILVNGSGALLIPGSPGYSIIDIDIEAAAKNCVKLLQMLICSPQSVLPDIISPYGEIIDRGSLMRERF